MYQRYGCELLKKNQFTYEKYADLMKLVREWSASHKCYQLNGSCTKEGYDAIVKAYKKNPEMVCPTALDAEFKQREITRKKCMKWNKTLGKLIVPLIKKNKMTY